MAKGKAVAGKPGVKSFVKAENKKDWKAEHKHLFRSEKKDFRIGRDILTRTHEVTRFVKWPRYVRLQRQKAILKNRLKVPPSIAQFTRTVPASQAQALFRLLAHYRPESSAEKKQRLVAAAKQEAAAAAADAQDPAKKPKMLKFGLNHITSLIETKKAKLVVIAHDVDPVELVLWLPFLCRKMDVPYCIVKGKARLGALVHQKTATAVALTEVRKEHVHELDTLVKALRPLYNDNVDSLKKWGGGILGNKATAAQIKKQKAAQRQINLKAAK